MSFDPNKKSWLILFEDGQRVEASCKTLLAFFRDLDSANSMLAASITGGAAEMTMYAEDKKSRCKVLHFSQVEGWATYENPFPEAWSRNGYVPPS